MNLLEITVSAKYTWAAGRAAAGLPAPGGPGGLSDHRQLQRDHRQGIPVHLKTQNARPLWLFHSWAGIIIYLHYAKHCFGEHITVQ